MSIVLPVVEIFSAEEVTRNIQDKFLVRWKMFLSNPQFTFPFRRFRTGHIVFPVTLDIGNDQVLLGIL
jgi:hypothetical protein